jgi:hypothetical protein
MISMSQRLLERQLESSLHNRDGTTPIFVIYPKFPELRCVSWSNPNTSRKIIEFVSSPWRFLSATAGNGAPRILLALPRSSSMIDAPAWTIVGSVRASTLVVRKVAAIHRRILRRIPKYA